MDNNSPEIQGTPPVEPVTTPEPTVPTPEPTVASSEPAPAPASDPAADLIAAAEKEAPAVAPSAETAFPGSPAKSGGKKSPLVLILVVVLLLLAGAGAAYYLLVYAPAKVAETVVEVIETSSDDSETETEEPETSSDLYAETDLTDESVISALFNQLFLLHHPGTTLEAYTATNLPFEVSTACGTPLYKDSSIAVPATCETTADDDLTHQVFFEFFRNAKKLSDETVDETAETDATTEPTAEAEETYDFATVYVRVNTIEKSSGNVFKSFYNSADLESLRTEENFAENYVFEQLPPADSYSARITSENASWFDIYRFIFEKSADGSYTLSAIEKL